VVDPRDHPKIGSPYYLESLPLADKEVVLTFDDGPVRPHSDRVLDVLAAECVKATFFLVGEQAAAYPEIVQRIAREGHVIGTHTMHHPRSMNLLPESRMEQEIDDGIAAVKAADGAAPAPFFRIPGFARSAVIESLAASRGLMTWNADIDPDDWNHRKNAQEVEQRVMTLLRKRGRGVILLHDIHARTAEALPAILRDLKVEGFHVVQVTYATAERPKTPTQASDWSPPAEAVANSPVDGPAKRLHRRRIHVVG
jgi:peptidoglycan/xylan/chitin deacetylase (PgdA/CDA1 family)